MLNESDSADGACVCGSDCACAQYAGINISGINGEVLPGQWEYQVRGVLTARHTPLLSYVEMNQDCR